MCKLIIACSLMDLFYYISWLERLAQDRKS